MSHPEPWPPIFALSGKYVRLEVLAPGHRSDLVEAVEDGELYRLWYTTIPEPENIGREIERRLALRAAGSMLPFAAIDLRSGRAVGMTTYMNIDSTTPRLEIGSTWYRRSVQRGPLNTECKLLLLRHAFEELSCIAVEFRTHVLNLQSRRAIERLGARHDGILRAHMIMANNTVRDTAVYSITAPEWPAVRANLEWQLEKPREGSIDRPPARE